MEEHQQNFVCGVALGFLVWICLSGYIPSWFFTWPNLSPINSYGFTMLWAGGLTDIIFILSFIYAPLSYLIGKDPYGNSFITGFTFAYMLPFIIMALYAGKVPPLFPP
jgi:hypothetical protein